MDQQRIDELQNQYFRAKLATIDTKRLKEAREYLERSRQPSGKSDEPDRSKTTAANRLSHENRRA